MEDACKIANLRQHLRGLADDEMTFSLYGHGDQQ